MTEDDNKEEVCMESKIDENAEVDTAASDVADAAASDAVDASADSPAPKIKNKKRAIVIGVIAVVLIAAGVGFWVWHEQPSFCSAIFHTPMDSYGATYDQELNTTGTDKWGNTVENTRGMLCLTHKATGATCMSCHVPTLSEQVSEGIGWITGNYYYPLEERSLDDLVAARGLENSDEFCLNESCHNLTRDDLIEVTSDMTRNPHVAQHGEVSCSECHKAHRASVNYCSGCHEDADIPAGWITAAQAAQLDYNG